MNERTVARRYATALLALADQGKAVEAIETEILQVARDHDAIVIMDDSHATGVLGATGRGTAEHFGVLERRARAWRGRGS